MNISDYKFSGRWSIQAIRTKAEQIEDHRSKIIFLKSITKLIEVSKPQGRESISTNASITIIKIKRYIDKLEQEQRDRKDEEPDYKLTWTGDRDDLIDIFFTLKNNTLGKDNRPLLDESNRKIAELIKTSFNIDLSVETIFDKLNPSKRYLKPEKKGAEGIEFLITKSKKSR